MRPLWNRRSIRGGEGKKIKAARLHDTLPRNLRHFDDPPLSSMKIIFLLSLSFFFSISGLRPEREEYHAVKGYGKSLSSLCQVEFSKSKTIKPDIPNYGYNEY